MNFTNIINPRHLKQSRIRTIAISIKNIEVLINQMEKRGRERRDKPRTVERWTETLIRSEYPPGEEYLLCYLRDEENQ